MNTFQRNRQRGGCATKLSLLLAVMAVLVGSAWWLLLPRLIGYTVRAKTGFELSVEKLSINPFTANVTIKGLVLRNPADWPARDFVELREFRADAKLFSLFGSRIEAGEVVVDVAHVTLVRNAQGQLNAVRFKDGFAGEPAAKAPAPQGKTEPGSPFLIKRLVVRLDRITYIDHAGRRPVTKEYPLAINREVRDVDTVAKLISPLYTANVAVVTEALGGMFKDSVDLLKETTGALKEAGQKAGEAVKGLLDKLKPKG